jgi:hypothetical protein
VALLFDGSGDDSFTVEGSHAEMVYSGGATTNNADGFSKVKGYANSFLGDSDEANLSGTAGQTDVFYLEPGEDRIKNSAGDFVTYAHAFDTVTALGDGSDVAILFDSVGVDTFLADPFTASMIYASGKMTNADAFQQVYADFSTDEGNLIELMGDPSADNRYSGSAGKGEMTDDLTYWIYLTGLDLIDDVLIDGADGTDDDDILTDAGIDYIFDTLDW